MKPISVVIPTANHPRLLETSLQSIARQTAASQIEEVVVSENRMTRESEAVCRRFKELPIRYILQDPQMPVSRHFAYLFEQAKAETVAFLCDDDWWGPGHLQWALVALNQHPKAVAWSSACLHAPGDTPWTGMVSRSPILWLVAGRPGVCETWHMGSHQALAAAWILTPFHISSLVIRQAAARQMVASFDTDHPYQIDRMWQVRLATLGAMLYEPLVDTYVREHGGALTWQSARDEREKEFRKCTAAIGRLCATRGIDPAALWKTYLAGLEGPILEDVGALFRMSLSEEQLRAEGFEQFVLPNSFKRMTKRIRTIARNRWKLYGPTVYKSLGLARPQAGSE